MSDPFEIIILCHDVTALAVMSADSGTPLERRGAGAETGYVSVPNLKLIKFSLALRVRGSSILSLNISWNIWTYYGPKPKPSDVEDTQSPSMYNEPIDSTSLEWRRIRQWRR